MKFRLSFILLLVVCSHLQAKIIMTPYLQAVTSNSVYVMVECDRPDTVTVSYSLTPDKWLTARSAVIALTDASPATYVHKVKLTGLIPGTRYSYFANQGNSTSGTASFSTAVVPGVPFRLVWMADCRTNTKVFAGISRNMAAANPVVAIYGGDLCHNPTYKAWKKEFFIKDQLDLVSQVPFFNATGNHEGWQQNTRAFTQGPASSSMTQDYYSFDYGDLHVLCLNYMIPYAQGTPQYEFAKSDLAQTRQPWKIVVVHSPAYCGGGHGEDAGMVIMTKEIFEPLHVDMVLAGHSHFYQHNLVNGIQHLVIGSAGAPLYSPEKAWYTVSQAKDYNFAVIDVSPEKILINVYNKQLVKLDSLEIAR